MSVDSTHATAGYAIVLGRRDSARVTIEHLSINAASLVGDFALARGERVPLLLHVVGSPSLGVIALVEHTEQLAGAYRLRVRFVDLDPAVDRRLRSIVPATERTRPVSMPAVLVVDDEEALCETVGWYVAEAGWVTVHARTSQELVRCTSDNSRDFRAALVNMSLAQLNACGVLAHLRDALPDLRRVLVVSDHALDDSIATIARGRAHATLRSRWDANGLFEAVGLLQARAS